MTLKQITLNACASRRLLLLQNIGCRINVSALNKLEAYTYNLEEKDLKKWMLAHWDEVSQVFTRNKKQVYEQITTK